MNESNELGVLRDIVEKLAAIDPWTSDGPVCLVCGSQPVLKRATHGATRDDGAYFYSGPEYGTHTTDQARGGWPTSGDVWLGTRLTRGYVTTVPYFLYCPVSCGAVPLGAAPLPRPR